MLGRVHGLKSGRMLKEFRGHTSYVNDAIFSADGSQVGPRPLIAGMWLGAASWQQCQCHVLLAGNADVCDSLPAQVISASSDATVRVWDAKSCDCITIFKCAALSGTRMSVFRAIACTCSRVIMNSASFLVCRPPQVASGAEQSVNSVHLNPQNAEQVVVCSRAPTAHVMTLQGQVVKTFQSGESESEMCAYLTFCAAQVVTML
jgi:WD40 repeat-containing protein SMU1